MTGLINSSCLFTKGINTGDEVTGDEVTGDEVTGGENLKRMWGNLRSVSGIAHTLKEIYGISVYDYNQNNMNNYKYICIQMIGLKYIHSNGYSYPWQNADRTWPEHKGDL